MAISFKTPWTHDSLTAGGRPMALSDMGNAERFVIAHAEDVRHIQVTRQWLAWDGTRFAPDSAGELKRRAKLTMRNILLEAAAMDLDKHRNEVITHQIRSESDRAIRAALSLAESDAAIAVRPDYFDRDPMLLNVANGTIDLEHHQLREHSRDNAITKLAPVRFDPNVTCPQWDRFLSQIFPDPELTAFVQRAAGYSLTGNASEECIFLLYGTGANGKSKFLEVLRYVFGDYALAADASTFLTGRGHPSVRNDVARLRGGRLVTAVESEAGKKLAESLLKVCTGGDTIAARFLYSEHFEFVPIFKLWLATNHKPRIIGTNEAIWRRIRLIPFTVTIPVEQRDRGLAEKLKSEASGILNWLLAGCRDWQAHGLGDSQAVRTATGTYRQESDVLGHFLDARVIVEANREVRASDLYSTYRSWAEESGEYTMNERDFSGALSDRGLTKRRSKDGWSWRCIALRV